MRKSILIISTFAILFLLLGVSYSFDHSTSYVPHEEEMKDSQIIEEGQQEEEDKEEEEPEQNQEEQANHNIASNIKETVKHVIEGAVNLFIKEDLSIVAIGDSLTQGVGDETNNGGYVGILNHTFEEMDQSIDIVNYGKRGNRSDQLLKRLEDPEISSSIENADLTLITIGANDIMKVVQNNFTNLHYEPFRVELDDYEDRLREIIERMKTMNPETEIYLLGIYNPFEKYFGDIEQLNLIIENWNQTNLAVASRYDQVTFVPIRDLFQDGDESLFAEDKFHPNINGYELMAERVLHFIKPSIEKKEDF
ncbi:SGNH/GDSL hydrolase family protein [Aquibacillus albus]|uniref:Lysophospholipase L1-like esterase n=1 Tax=Aquibacillus albus TaxID=1168171 RepID=A0ABS2MXD4_9BACI|nr:SGNH/GDSL hydrolase family protein [Aquibacillus albus]MBM7570542.1 lysophospholipase L1-like esterase [Aquibacillus albus]